MEFGQIRRALIWLKMTPFHPQWFAFLEEKRMFPELAKYVSGRILDVGCGERRVEKKLSPDSEYIGLDYLATASQWYGTKPHIYGDAARLPIADKCMDNVLVLDVLEHLPNPAACITELARVLRPGGRIVIQVPFLYPIHDAPLDFSRWTIHGLRRLAQNHGLQIIHERTIGSPLETSTLLTNLALGKLVLESARRGNLLALLAPVLPFFFLLSNILAWLVSRLAPCDGFMAHGYRIVLEKQLISTQDPPNAAAAH